MKTVGAGRAEPLPLLRYAVNGVSRGRLRHSFKRLWLVHQSDHSTATFFTPRSENRLRPRSCI